MADPEGGSTTHTIEVGYNGYGFNPNQTTAEKGDVLEFMFLPTNHSVVRSEWMWPCTPIESTGSGKESLAFFSSFYTVQPGAVSPKWRYTLTTDEPIFFYSSAGSDCNVYGMVGSVNAAEAEFEHQYSMALDAQQVLQPPSLSSEDDDGDGGDGQTTTGPTNPSTPGPNTAEDEPKTIVDEGTKLSAAAIAGIVIGSVLVLVAIGFTFFIIGRLSKRRRNTPPATPLHTDDAHSHPPPPMTQQGHSSSSPGPSPGLNTAFMAHDINSHPAASNASNSPDGFTGSGGFRGSRRISQTRPGTIGEDGDDDIVYLPVKRSQMWSAGGGGFGGVAEVEVGSSSDGVSNRGSIVGRETSPLGEQGRPHGGPRHELM